MNATSRPAIAAIPASALNGSHRENRRNSSNSKVPGLAAMVVARDSDATNYTTTSAEFTTTKRFRLLS